MILDDENKKNIRTQTNRYLEFSLGKESYVVELLKVKEVITPPELTAIPKSPSYVSGLMNLRGLVLSVIDLRMKLGITPHPKKDENAVIILDLGDRLLGVIVDSVQKVITAPEDCVRPVPDEGCSREKYLLGVIQFNQKLSLWIDPKLILDGSEKLQKVV